MRTKQFRNGQCLVLQRRPQHSLCILPMNIKVKHIAEGVAQGHVGEPLKVADHVGKLAK